MQAGPRTQWDRLFHAYGPADDALLYLEALRRGDQEGPPGVEPSWLSPYSYLWSGLFCGGQLTPAIVPALRYLASAVAEPDFGGQDPTLREGVVWFFREVARTAGGHPNIEAARLVAVERDAPAVMAWMDGYLLQRRSIMSWTPADDPGWVLLTAAQVDCYDLLPELFAAVEPSLAVRHPSRLRLVAAAAAAMLVRHPALTHRHPDILAHHLSEVAGLAISPHELGSLLIGIGELGGEPRTFLDHPHGGVRICAALAPALSSEPSAIDVLVTAAHDPGAVSTTFGTRPVPQAIDMLPVLINALCERVRDFNRLLDAALALLSLLAAPGKLHRPDGANICRQYLQLAFPLGLPDGRHATSAQRAFAAALANLDEPWSHNTEWDTMLTHAGLPTDRQAWSDLGPRQQHSGSASP